MSGEKRIKFGIPRRLPMNRDAIEYQFPFNVVDVSLIGMPEEENETERHQIKVGISDTLAVCWRLDIANLVKVLFEYGKRHIIEKLKDGTLGAKEELWLTTANYPTTCPFDPSRISDPAQAIINLKVPQNTLMENLSEIQLASSIIDYRDNINALFGQKYGEKLLLIDQERNLLGFFREANSQEEFVYRVVALANAATNLNVPILRKLTNISNAEVKSISLLEAWLKKLDSQNKVIQTLRNLNRIRQGYPVHGDHVDGVLEAYQFFGIGYPVRNFSEAWKKVLQSYLAALEELLEIIASAKPDKAK